MNKKDLSDYFAKIGRKGGKKSKRTLTKEAAQAMGRRSAKLKKEKLAGEARKPKK